MMLVIGIKSNDAGVEEWEEGRFGAGADDDERKEGERDQEKKRNGSRSRKIGDREAERLGRKWYPLSVISDHSCRMPVDTGHEPRTDRVHGFPHHLVIIAL